MSNFKCFAKTISCTKKLQFFPKIAKHSQICREKTWSNILENYAFIGGVMGLLNPSKFSKIST